jgi:RNA polymerase sigma factor (sigma-70 family)
VVNTIPDMETAYREVRPMLFRALGKLARQGFVVSPADSLDLIHDFFADEWQKVMRNFDPAKGNYKAYAYGAFVQFVRPRIVRMQRLQNYQVRPEEIEAIGEEIGAVQPEWETAPDRELVQHAIAGLPELEREVLSGYVYADIPSERMLARRFSLSRYKLRETLVHALGRVLVSLDRPSLIPERDWEVALALWRDGRSIDEASKYLGMTKHQLRAANIRNFKFLERTLSSYQPSRGPDWRAQEMESKMQTLTPEQLFESAVESPGDMDLLRQIEERGLEVIEALDRPDTISIPDEELINLDPLWVAKVYETLARSAGSVDVSPEAEDELFYANADSEYQIGIAYKQSLIPGLPPELADLAGRWLVDLPFVEEEEMRDTLMSPASRGAYPLSEPLARYGVTPLTILDVTGAVSRLTDRLLRRRRLDTSSPVTLWSGGINSGELVDTRMVVDEISRVAVCRETTARVLYEWTRRVAQFKPLFFNGFRAETAEGSAVVLYPSGEKVKNLHQRWGLAKAVERALVNVW